MASQTADLSDSKYSDIRIRKVKILEGKAKDAALAKGYSEDDLVILKTSEYHSQPTYAIEKIEGDPTEHLFRSKSKK